MDKRLTKQEIKTQAAEFGYEYEAVKAVIDVECSGSGFTDDGVIKIQFEPHHFKEKLINNGVENQAKEWQAFDEAYKINKESAFRATSWGLGQIMGFNHSLAGYPSAEAMVKDFNKGEAQQLKGMLTMIKSQRGLDLALKNKNWKQFAYLYNGPAYARNSYDIKLQDAYKRHKDV